MFDEVIFDLETKSFFVDDGKFDPSKFGKFLIWKNILTILYKVIALIY